MYHTRRIEQINGFLSFVAKSYMHACKAVIQMPRWTTCRANLKNRSGSTGGAEPGRT